MILLVFVVTLPKFAAIYAERRGQIKRRVARDLLSPISSFECVDQHSELRK